MTDEQLRSWANNENAGSDNAKTYSQESPAPYNGGRMSDDNLFAWSRGAYITPQTYERVGGVSDRYQDQYLMRQNEQQISRSPVNWGNFSQKAGLWSKAQEKVSDYYSKVGRPMLTDGASDGSRLRDVDDYVRALQDAAQGNRAQAQELTDFLTQNEWQAIRKLGVNEYLDILLSLDRGTRGVMDLSKRGEDLQDYLGDLTQQQRQETQQEARRSLFGSLWDWGSAFAEQAQMNAGGIMDPGRENELAKKQSDAADAIRAAFGASRDVARATDWEGRDELIAELERLQKVNLGLESMSMDPNPMYDRFTREAMMEENEQSMAKIRAEIEARDRDYGNGQRDYTAVDKFASIVGGSMNAAAGAVAKAGVMIGDLASKRMANDADFRAAVEQAEDFNAMFEPETVRKFAGREVRSEEDLARWQELYDKAAALGDEGQLLIAKAKNGLGLLGQAGVDIAENLIQMGFDSIVGAPFGSALVPMFVRVLGDEGYQALLDGATLEEAMGYGAAKGGIEVFTEKINDGVAGIYGKGFADDLSDALINRMSDSAAGKFIIRMLYDAVQEGNEEVLSDLLSPLAEKIYKDESLKDLYGQIDKSEVIYDWLIGTAIGTVGSVTSAATGKYSEANAKDQALMDIYARMGETPTVRQEMRDRAILERLSTDAGFAREAMSGAGEDNVGDGLPHQRAALVRNDAAGGVEDARAAEGVGPYNGEHIKADVDAAMRALRGEKTETSRARELMDANRSAVVDAVQQQIEGRGEDVIGEARSLANAVVADARGEGLSENQKKLAERNREIFDTLKQELTGEKRAKWARDVILYGRRAITGGAGEDAIRQAQDMHGAVTNARTVMTAEAGGESGTIVGVVKGEDGNVAGYQVKTESGVKEITQQEAGLNQAQQIVAEALTGGEYAEEKLANLQDGQNAADYVEDFDYVAEVMGNSSLYENAEEAWKEVGDSTDLTRGQFDAAFEAGRQRRDSAPKTAFKERGSGEVSFEAYNDGTTEYAAPSEADVKAFRETAKFDVLQRIAKAAGVDLVFFKADSKVNGEYRQGKVFINMDAAPGSRAELGSYVMQTAAHELTHYLREKDPARYAELKDFVVRRLIETGKLENGKTLKELIRDKQALYERAGQSLTVDGVIEEVVADACEMVLNNEKMLARLEKDNAKLARSFRDYMRSFLRKIRKAFTGAEATHAEAKAMQGVIRDLSKIWGAGVFGEGEAVGAKNATTENAAQESGGKYAFAGEKSETADRETLERAKEMEKQGADNEAIRQETGWFRGMDNMWRYEIDMRDAVYSRRGDLNFRKEEPEYGRYRELTEKAEKYLIGESDQWLTDEEQTELTALQAKWGSYFKKDGMLNEDSFRPRMRLSDYFQDEKLFAAYPKLANMLLRWDKLTGGASGEYNALANTITLNDTEEMRHMPLKTLFHEIQHVIQDIEGFTPGTSPGYWSNKASSLERRITQYEELIEEAKDIIGLKDFVKESLAMVKNGDRTMNEHFKAVDDFIGASDQAERIRFFQEALNDLQEQRAGMQDAYSMYANTAGEIEARDAAFRSQFVNDRQYRTIKPNLGDENTVFADDRSVKYSIKDDSVTTSIKQQIKAYSKELNSKPVVTSLKVSDMPSKDIQKQRKWVETRLKNTGYAVDKKGLGRIEFTPSQINTGLNYLNDPGEIAAFAALPAVLKRGDIIDQHESHKGRQRSSITIAAPVEINGVRGNMAVALTQTGKTHYHAHRILMPDGSTFIFENQNDAELTPAGELPAKQALIAEPISSTSKGSIADAVKNSNTPNGKKSLKDEDAVSDRELLANTPLDAARNDGELRRFGDYKKQLDAFYVAQDEFGMAEEKLTEAWHSGDKARIKEATRARDRASARLSRADDKLRAIRETKPMQTLLSRAQGDEETRRAAQDSEEAAEKQRTYNQLRADNKALREQVQRLKRELKPTKDRTVRRSDARRIAQDILKDTGSGVTVSELTDVIETMGNYLVSTPSEELDDQKLFRMAQRIAKEIVDTTELPAETGMEEVHDKLKSYLRGTKLQIGKEYVKDLGQETLAMWRRQNPGVIVSTESGTPVDSAYMELQEMLGEGLLPEGVTHPADQLNLISGLLQDSGKEQFYNPYRGYETETAARIADDIVNAVFSEALRETAPTMADKMNAMREKNRARVQLIRSETRSQIAEVRAKERAAKWSKVQEVKEHYLRKEAKARESRRSSELRQKIRKLHGEMSNDLLKPRKDHYVPETLRKPIAELLEAVNTDSGRSVRLKDAVEQLNVQYRKIAETGEGSYAFDQGVADMLQKLQDMLVEKGGDTSIFNMSKDELGLVYNTMRAVNHTLRTAVKLINYETEKNIFQIARGMMDETRQAAPKGVGVKVLDGAYDRWLSASMRPETFFRRLAGYRKGSNWEMMADMLNSAQLKQTRLQMEGAAIFEELMRDTKALDAMTDRKKLIDIGLRDADGNAVKVTKDMALMLYLHTLNEDNTRHLVYGGLTVPDMRQYYGGKASAAYGKGSVRVFGFGEELSELSRDLRHAESEEDRQEVEARIRDAEARANTWVHDLQNSIIQQMGDYEKAWIKAAQRFFNDFSQKSLNETTRAVYGFEKATVENYAPIHTDPAYRQAEFESIARDISLENSGFMKERILNAKNPMLAEGLVDVVSTQIDNVAKYAAMMPAVRNFQKVYGKTRTGFTDSVQAGVRQYFGNNALKYIENIMTDLTSPRRTEGGMLGEFADRLRGNLAAASLTLNPRVALGQASSYPTAAAVVGWKPLVKAFGLGKNPMRDAQARQEIARWSPLMWYRMQGFFDRDVGDLRSRKGASDRISDRLSFLTNWIELMDGATVGRLWYAAQAYVADTTELERGSDEFMQESAKVFNQIVERTQPNYTTFQRPDILRNPNAIVKQLTMFMTQRLQNANILYDAVGTYNAAVRDRRAGKNGVTDADIKEARQGLTRAVTSQLAATASITVFKLLADALMYSMKAYRDDDDELTKESVMKKLLLNMSESAASNFLWGAELYDAASKVITGDKYYGVSLNGVESFTDAAKTLVKTLQYFTGGEKTQEKTLKQLEYLAKDAGQLLGIPYANGEKFVKAVMNRVNDVREGNGWGSFMSEIKLTDERRAKLLYRALESGDKDAAQKQYETFGEMADANKALQKYIREAYKAGNMSDEEARKALQEYADMSRYDSEVSIGRLKLEVDHGIQYDELREQYVAGEISREEAIDWQVEYGSEKRHNVEKEVRRWDCEKETGYEYDKLQDYVAAGDITEDQAVEYRVKYGGQEEPDAIADVAKWMCEIETGIPYDSIQEYYANGWIDRETLIEDYKQYGLMDDELAERVANKRDFIGLDYDLNDISLSASDDYYKYAAGLGVDKHLYYDAWKQGNAIHADYNSNGKAIAYSAMDKKLRYIDSLPLDNQQKTAIALCYGISSKNINSRAPWKKW